jgi:hypothetical protein
VLNIWAAIPCAIIPAPVIAILAAPDSIITSASSVLVGMGT